MACCAHRGWVFAQAVVGSTGHRGRAQQEPRGFRQTVPRATTRYALPGSSPHDSRRMKREGLIHYVRGRFPSVIASWPGDARETAEAASHLERTTGFEPATPTLATLEPGRECAHLNFGHKRARQGRRRRSEVTRGLLAHGLIPIASGLRAGRRHRIGASDDTSIRCGGARTGPTSPPSVAHVGNRSGPGEGPGRKGGAR
jgi:hypothetical protein